MFAKKSPLTRRQGTTRKKKDLGEKKTRQNITKVTRETATKKGGECKRTWPRAGGTAKRDAKRTEKSRTQSTKAQNFESPTSEKKKRGKGHKENHALKKNRAETKGQLRARPCSSGGGRKKEDGEWKRRSTEKRSRHGFCFSAKKLAARREG